jgi:glucosylceramidase
VINELKLNKIKVIQTAKDTKDRLTPKPDLLFQVNQPERTIAIEINPLKKYQEIIGFGGAFTEATAFTVANLSPEKRAEIINAYFHPEKGLNYSLCRTHMNSCDFCLGNYACDQVAGDVDLRFFNIEHDKIYLIPMIKEAMKIKGTPLNLFISPWSPPGWMKTNHQMNNGGKLKEEYRATWALFFAKFIKAYEAEGVPIWGLTIQNEPDSTQVWDSCRYTVEEERDFVRDYLGPTLKREGLASQKIIIWDHNRDLLYERARVILMDKKAADYVWGVGFHWYSGDQFDNVAETHDAFPGKYLIFTEGCWEGGIKLGQWDRGERYGHHIIGDLNHWTNGWVDWNMVLDQMGGPNHAGNLCDAPIIVEPNTDTIYYQNSYYYLGHFSKFIRPGAKRIDCRSNNRHLETTAFENPDGSIAVVVLNCSDREHEFQLKMGPKSVDLVSLAHSIVSYIIGE